jgi:hypothetical protein
MIDIPGELEGIEIEIEGGTEAIADELRKAFNGEDEDVVFGHSFGGTEFERLMIWINSVHKSLGPK